MKKAFFHFRSGQGGKLKLELHALSFRYRSSKQKSPVLVLGLNLGAGSRNPSIYPFRRMAEEGQDESFVPTGFCEYL
jgi:hypothetical protein